MKNLSKILWGIVFIAAGVVLAINALGLADVKIFFDGWWTLFIIIPCLVGLFTEKEKTGNIIGLLVGAGLLLACRDVITFGTFWKLVFPAIIILIGLRLVLGAFFKKSRKEKDGSDESKWTSKIEGGGKNYCAVFSGIEADVTDEVFEGTTATAVFGGVELDLRRAIIEHDVTIEATAVFGGVDILLPQNVNVHVSSTSIFGGVDDKTRSFNAENTITVHVTGTAIFGGVDVK